VATAQLVTRSFRTTALASMAIGVIVGIAGVIISFHAYTPSGATIVVLAIMVFLGRLRRAVPPPRRGHGVVTDRSRQTGTRRHLLVGFPA
jgi:zinc transport system permease protein